MSEDGNEQNRGVEQHVSRGRYCEWHTRKEKSTADLRRIEERLRVVCVAISRASTGNNAGH